MQKGGLLVSILGMFSSTALAQMSSSMSESMPSPTSSMMMPSSTPSADANMKIGWSGMLSSLDGGLGGTVMVVNATALLIKDYVLEDAGAPALYWWGSMGSNLGGGFRISNRQMNMVSEGMDLEVDLDSGKTVADFDTVGLWCEEFGVNFGQTTLRAEGSMGGGGTGDGEGDMEKGKESSAMGRVAPGQRTVVAGIALGIGLVGARLMNV